MGKIIQFWAKSAEKKNRTTTFKNKGKKNSAGKKATNVCVNKQQFISIDPNKKPSKIENNV